MSKLAFLVEGEFALLIIICGCKSGLHGLEQRGVVGFELQGVMRPVLRTSAAMAG
jgi:hypothetical protein